MFAYAMKELDHMCDMLLRCKGIQSVNAIHRCSWCTLRLECRLALETFLRALQGFRDPELQYRQRTADTTINPGLLLWESPYIDFRET